MPCYGFQTGPPRNLLVNDRTPYYIKLTRFSYADVQMCLCIVRWVCALKGHGIRLFHSLLSSTTGLRNNGKQWILRTLNWVCSESYDVTRKFRVPTRNALWFDFIELPRYSHFTSAKCCSFCTVWELPSFALLLSLSKQKLIKYVRSVFINCPSGLGIWFVRSSTQYT